MKTYNSLFTYVILALSFIILNTISLNSFGQPLNKITFQRGGGVQIIYNSLEKFLGGVDLNNYTKMKFRFNDITSTGWQLKLKSSSNVIKADEPSNPDINIAPDTLTVQITSFNFTPFFVDSATFNASPIIPSTGEQIIAEGHTGHTGVLDIVTVEIEFSYSMKPMLNRREGYFNVELLFELVAK